MRSVLTYYLESKPSLNCWIAVERAEITFIAIHINANQNSYHDDKSSALSVPNYSEICGLVDVLTILLLSPTR